MSLLLDAPNDLRGCQQPRVSSVPPYVSTTGDEAIELAHLAGLDLDPWQQAILRAALGERADGQWAAFEVGVMVPRQNGKGGLLEARELAGLFLLPERLLVHSAHQFDTSLEAFHRLLALIEDTPSLSKRIPPRGGVSQSHGKEGITLRNGKRIRYRTRTKTGGRGFSADLLILDEAMDIPAAMHGTLLPILSARDNPQVWYTGSAVDQQVHDNGTVFARIRERGHRGDDPSLAYFEHSVGLTMDEVTTEAVENPGLWAQANPALGIRITTEYVGYERASLGLREFAVERLGIGDWPETSSTLNAKLIDGPIWAACKDAGSEPVGPVCLAFDVPPDRSGATISLAGRREDGLPHIAVASQHRGIRWVAGAVVQLMADRQVASVVCDALGAAASLVPELESQGIEVVTVSAKEAAAAAGLLYDAIIEARVRHLGTAELTEAVDGAATRPLGDRWLWARRSALTDISPLVACGLALWGLQTSASGIGVASMADFEKRMGPDRLAEIQRKHNERVEAILAKARQQ